MKKVAINGLGRIGRSALKVILDTPQLELIAVNDIISEEDVTYLLKYDSVYGTYDKEVGHRENEIIIEGTSIKKFNEKDPSKLPWKEEEIDIVFECSGLFTEKKDMEKHLEAGASHVILSAPGKGDGITFVIPGINEPEAKDKLISTASCTTNCIAPVIEILNRRIGVEKAIMTTVHAYTSSQALVDTQNKKRRRGRAAAVNFVPTSTGAAKATSKVLKEMENIFDGVAIRGPVPCGSISDVTVITKKETSAEEINKIFKEEAAERYKGVLGASEEELVSSDIIKDSRASIVDTEMTMVVGGNLAKVMSWYDNEWGYVNQMIRTGVKLAEKI